MKNSRYINVLGGHTILVILVLSLGAVPVLAAGPGPADPAELEAFLDDVIQAQMEELHVPGVTVSVVKDGALFFAKGYGYADVEKGIAVDAETSLFRIGSGSKLFTWTAVMQLVEQGKLDLDADINTYLDFRIPATYPEPITMKHLMSHSAGFEDAIFEMLAPSPEKSVPLGEWLAAHIPARVYRPGETSGYSNYGTALAGYIVQIIAGMPYEQYIQEHIFDPLEMTQSTAYQPVQPEFAPHLATGYMYASDAYQAQAFEHFNIGPAGSISTSATDVAKFMLAHLQDGQLGNAQILEPATAQQMHSTLFTNDPRLNGIAYGFIEGSQNGQWILSHAGSTVFFKANLVLLPDQNVGIFVAGNSAGADSLRYTVVEAFIDRYYPAPDAPAPQPLTGVDLSRFVGGYRTTRSSYYKMAKSTYLLLPFDVGATADGYLTVNGRRFMPIEPLLFQEVGGQEKLAFRQDAQGNITHVFENSHPIWAYEKQVGLASTSSQHTLILFCLAICVLTLVTWLIGAFINRHKGQTQPQLARMARWVIAGVTILTAVVIALAYKDVFSPIVSKLPLMRGEISPLLLVPTLATLAAVLALGATVLAGSAWKQGYWTLVGRIHYTLVTLVGLVFAWWFNFWNLVGWKF